MCPFPTDPSEDDEESDDEPCAAWNQWCWDKYLAPSTGSAFLLRVWNGETLEPVLLAEYPELKVLRTLSCWPQWQQHDAENP